jgi:hypothetical protein
MATTDIYKYVNDEFNALYSDITDATPTEEWFKLSSVLGETPCLSHYSPKTQRMILTAAFKTMQGLPEESDGLIKKGNFYKWRLAKR